MLYYFLPQYPHYVFTCQEDVCEDDLLDDIMYSPAKRMCVKTTFWTTLCIHLPRGCVWRRPFGRHYVFTCQEDVCEDDLLNDIMYSPAKRMCVKTTFWTMVCWTLAFRHLCMMTKMCQLFILKISKIFIKNRKKCNAKYGYLTVLEDSVGCITFFGLPLTGKYACKVIQNVWGFA